MSRPYFQQLEALLYQGKAVRVALNQRSLSGVPNWYLAGCSVAQTVWNVLLGLEPTGLNAESGQAHEQRINEMLRLPFPVGVRDQVRVHLWYEQKFGYPVFPYSSSKDDIVSFPATCAFIGVSSTGQGLAAFSAFGLDDLFEFTVCTNKRQITSIYENTARRRPASQPALKAIPWHTEAA